MREVHKNTYSVINIVNTSGYIHKNIDKWLCTITYELCKKIRGNEDVMIIFYKLKWFT